MMSASFDKEPDMASKLLRIALIRIFFMLVGAGLFSAGFVSGHTAAFSQTPLTWIPFLNTGPQPGLAGTPDELTDEFAPFWEAWDLVHEEFVDQPVDDQQ